MDLAHAFEKHGIWYETPDSPRYEELRQAYQARKDLQYQPSYLTFPKTPEQVSTILQRAKAAGYKVSPRGGGHSAISGSLGGANGHVVIDMRLFDEVVVDQETGIAAIGAGVKQGPAYQKLHDQGERFISGGVCPNIGLAGALSHGAYGFVHRALGMGVDNVVAYDIVLADGSIEHVNALSDSELYWALRGAASSFVIVTTFHVQTHKEPTPRLYSWELTLPPEEISEYALLYQRWANSPLAYPNINAACIVEFDAQTPPGQLKATFFLFSRDLDDDLDGSARPFLKALPPPSMANVQMPWITLAAAYGPLDLHNMTKQAAHYEKSVILDGDWPEKSLREAYDYAANHRPSDPEHVTSYRLIFDLLGGTDSQVNKISRETSSWSKRDAKFLVWAIAESKGSTYLSDSSIDFIDGIFNRIGENIEEKDWGSYLNYADTRVDDWKLRYYGKNYERLSALKRRVDPSDLISTPLGVKP